MLGWVGRGGVSLDAFQMLFLNEIKYVDDYFVNFFYFWIFLQDQFLINGVSLILHRLSFTYHLYITSLTLCT